MGKRSKTIGLEDKETQSENKGKSKNSRETTGRQTQEVHADVYLLPGFERFKCTRWR